MFSAEKNGDTRRKVIQIHRYCVKRTRFSALHGPAAHIQRWKHFLKFGLFTLPFHGENIHFRRILPQTFSPGMAESAKGTDEGLGSGNGAQSCGDGKSSGQGKIGSNTTSHANKWQDIIKALVGKGPINANWSLIKSHRGF
jgi:hypothetical protein